MKKYLALDLGGTYLKAATIDENINIIDKWKVDSSKAKSIDELLEVFDKAVLSHLDGVSGIAISCPGRIDVKKGFMITAGHFDDFLCGFEIVKVLEERYHLPVSADNDGKCAANAEVWKGALKDVANGLVYVIGTAIGGGIVINHQVYRGSNFASGEFSQLILNKNNEVADGNFECDDVSTFALLDKYIKKKGLETKISGEEFFNLVNTGDELATNIFNEFCMKAAKSLYNLQVCFDFEVIAIGGGISAQDILIEKVNEELDKIYQNFSLASVKPKVVRCKFSNDANLIGAVKSMIDNKGGQL